jgi:uncharacterized membrane protein
MIRFRSPLNIAFVVLGGLATVAGFLLVPAGMSLPAHWGIDGQPDLFLPRNWALLQMPAVIAAVWVIFWAIDRWGNGERRQASTHVMNVGLSAITGLFVLIQVLVVLVGVGVAVDVVRAVLVGVGLLQIALGNAMPKSQPNTVAGIRIPTTLADPANWQATHRFGGILMILGGLATLAATVLLPVGPWLFVAVIAGFLVPVIVASLYSLAYARSHRLDGAQR